MELVANDYVKMEWEKEKWVQTKSGKFICTAKTFKNDDGVDIDVFFTPFFAFIFEDEDSEEENATMTFSTIKKQMKGGVDNSFPDMWDGFWALVDSGSVDNEPFEVYKLQSCMDEIVERAKDISNMAGENVMNM